MVSNIVEVLSEGIYLTLVGMASVALALSLIIVSVKCLNWCFPAEEVSEKDDEKEDEAPSDEGSNEIPEYVIAAVAVEHERRQSPIGSELKSSQEISHRYLSEGRIVRD